MKLKAVKLVLGPGDEDRKRVRVFEEVSKGDEETVLTVGMEVPPGLVLSNLQIATTLALNAKARWPYPKEKLVRFFL